MISVCLPAGVVCQQSPWRLLLAPRWSCCLGLWQAAPRGERHSKGVIWEGAGLTVREVSCSGAFFKDSFQPEHFQMLRARFWQSLTSQAVPGLLLTCVHEIRATGAPLV